MPIVSQRGTDNGEQRRCFFLDFFLLMRKARSWPWQTCEEPHGGRQGSPPWAPSPGTSCTRTGVCAHSQGGGSEGLKRPEARQTGVEVVHTCPAALGQATPVGHHHGPGSTCVLINAFPSDYPQGSTSLKLSLQMVRRKLWGLWTPSWSTKGKRTVLTPAHGQALEPRQCTTHSFL